jgi:hypothetical protein
MKRIIAFSVLALFCFSSMMAQVKMPDNAFYQHKVERYTKLKKTGTSLGLAGGALTAMGIALVSNAKWTTSTDAWGNETTTTDTSGAFGIITISVGVPMAVTGIVLHSIGSRKAKYYQSKLENVSLGIIHTPQQKGISLAIKF